MNLVFALFSDAQGTYGLRIRIGQQGHAIKSSASRIRRRSRQHLAEVYALGGATKDRLCRCHIPMVIARTYEGARMKHDRANVTGPCRG